MRKNSTVGKSSVTRKRANRKLTVGIDLGDRSSRYCILDEQGEILVEGSMATTKKGFAQVLGSKPRSRVVLEVGTHSPWVSRYLADLGHEVIVANPRRVRLITDSTRKDDRLDAKTLARLARIDPELLSPIRHRSERAQADLMVIRARALLVEARTMLVNAARGLTKSYGERLGSCGTGQVSEELARSLSEPLHRGHPSRLPYGSLRSAWTGPGRDAGDCFCYEGMADCERERICLTRTGLLMEGLGAIRNAPPTSAARSTAAPVP
jgi:transposase